MSSKKIVSLELERFMPTLNWMLFPFIPSAETIEGLLKFPVKAPLFKKSVHNPPSNLYWDLMDLVPGIKVYGVEDHEYPIKKSLPSVRKKISYVSAYYNVKYKKNYFDFVHAHNSIYRYSMRDLIKIIKKINYISKKSHITIPVYYTEKERSKFLDWSLLGGVILKEKEWKQMFKFLNYKGDYYFSGPKSYGL